MYDFPVHDCTQEQNGSPQFPSIVRKCKWPSLSRKSEIQKVCYHGNLTSQFSSLLKKANEHFNCKLCRHARLRAKPLTWKWFFILMQIKLICIRKVLHLAWFWKWESLELGRAWPIDRHFGEWNLFVQIVDATPGWMRPSKYRFSPRHFICSLLWYSDITPVYPERNLLVKLIMILGLVCPCQQIKITLPLRLIVLKTGR